MGADEVLYGKEGAQLGALTVLLDGQQRRDIRRLFSFLYMAHGYAVHTPQRVSALNDLAATWQRIGDAPMRELELTEQDDHHTQVSKAMARLKIIHGFDIAWVDAFLVSMLMNTKPRTFKTLKSSLKYVHGSSEVIGLMVASLLRLPKDAHEAAVLQGRATQWLFFVRNLAADSSAGRCYFPQDDLKAYGLKDTQETTARKQPEAFVAFVQCQLARYGAWQHEAMGPLPYLPRRTRTAMHTVVDANNYIARAIAKDPFVVFSRRVSAGQPRLIVSAIGHLFD